LCYKVFSNPTLQLIFTTHCYARAVYAIVVCRSVCKCAVTLKAAGQHGAYRIILQN